MEQTNGTSLAEAYQPDQVAQLSETVSLLYERIAELESLTTEDVGWDRLGGETDREFSRDFLRRIVALSRLMFLKNPLINRGVTVQTYYVFGQGMSIAAEADPVDDVVQAFLDDRQNQAELTSHQARSGKEQTLQIDGNVFFVLFTSRANGRVTVRSIPVDEVADIVTNPEDAREPWYYVRQWTRRTFDPATGQTSSEAQRSYYPDWRYRPARQQARIGEAEVLWDAPVYHVKVGGLDGMRFGVPETYAALDWARAYKSFLEDWATITKALARFAWKLTVTGGPRGAAAARAKLNTTIGTTGQGGTGAAGPDRNPPPLPGSTWITGTQGTDMSPIRTAGATTSAEDGRQLRLMVAAAMGLPDTFFGDADQGTLATARSLDRPTELKFSDRQTLWADVTQDILQYVIDQAVSAPGGTLGGHTETDLYGETTIVLDTDPETGEPYSRHVAITFPPILEHDVSATVGAIVDAATLGGHPLADTFDLELVSRLLLEALGVDDIDEVMARLYPPDDQVAPDDGDGTEPPDGPQSPPVAPETPSGATDGTGASARPDPSSEARAARRGRGSKTSRTGPRRRALRETDTPIPRGNALDLDDDELALLAAVGPDDLARAESLWRAANAGTVTADLMAATEEDGP